MLRSIHIENIAVIEKTDITFDDGFNVLTGETGAGKSIIIDAINAILGERTSRELVRTGADNAVVIAVFDRLSDAALTALHDYGYDVDDDGCLLIQRKISSDGKSVCRIGGLPATVGILKEIGRQLVNIHGQHDSQQLLDEQSHMALLDAVAEDGELLRDYRAKYERMLEIKHQLSQIETDEAAKQRMVDLLNYQIDELEAANLMIGERESLTARKNLIRNSGAVLNAVNTAYFMLRGGDDAAGAAALTHSAGAEISTVARYLSDCEPLAARLNDAAYELDDIADELYSLMESAEFDPSELDRIEARLDAIYRLSLKYGENEEKMLEFLTDARRQLEQIEQSDELIIRLTAQLNDCRMQTVASAEMLSQARRRAAVSMADAICRELSYLDMPSVKFVADIQPTELFADGADSIKFLISTNVGEPPKPLSKIASGGELSRIMLAIKSVIADKDTVGTLIFDEVDTGVSGSAAQKVGVKLQSTSRGKQVVCVTHLAQIAALADCHMKISKSNSGGRTYTEVESLDRNGRIDEVARIMSTGVITDNMLKLAAELIDGQAE